MMMRTLLSGAAVVALSAIAAPHFMLASPSALANDAEARSAALGYTLGQVEVFEYKDLIHLRSDRHNDSVADHVQLPPGFVIENVWAEVTHKKYHATYAVSWRQPNSVHIEQSVGLTVSKKADKAQGIFNYFGGKAEALGELKRFSEALRYGSFVSADSHAVVNYRGFADGHKYSSRDGEIDVTVWVRARYVGTVNDISAKLLALADSLSNASAEVIKSHTKKLQDVTQAATSAAGGSGEAVKGEKPQT